MWNLRQNPSICGGVSLQLRFPLAGYLPPCKGGVNSRHRGGKKMEEIVERHGKLRPVMSRGNGGD